MTVPRRSSALARPKSSECERFDQVRSVRVSKAHYCTQPGNVRLGWWAVGKGLRKFKFLAAILAHIRCVSYGSVRAVRNRRPWAHLQQPRSSSWRPMQTKCNGHSNATPTRGEGWASRCSFTYPTAI